MRCSETPAELCLPIILYLRVESTVAEDEMDSSAKGPVEIVGACLGPLPMGKCPGKFYHRFKYLVDLHCDKILGCLSILPLSKYLREPVLQLTPETIHQSPILPS
jgi:hypothetical protein